MGFLQLYSNSATKKTKPINNSLASRLSNSVRSSCDIRSDAKGGPSAPGLATDKPVHKGLKRSREAVMPSARFKLKNKIAEPTTAEARTSAEFKPRPHAPKVLLHHL